MPRKQAILPLITFFCILLFISGCASPKLIIDLTPPKQPEPSGQFRAGAAKVDITPPPGYPMGGYAIAGRFARGWWTRLYTKSIYLEDRKGNRLALVICDLWSLPAGLADRVVEILAAGKDRAVIGREQLVIAASHTHNSPGNFSSSELYNSFASPGMGFDRALFEFLAQRIASGLSQAIKNSKPAVIKTGAIKLAGLTRNRSLEAFNSNNEDEKQEIIKQVSEEDAIRLFKEALPLSVTSPKNFRAVDPTLTVLKFEATDAEEKSPIAVAAFFAMHQTAMGPTTEVYNGDVFGVAANLVEHHLNGSEETGNSVVAIFNGAEGDISPNWQKQNRRNTFRLGQELAKGILEAAAQAQTMSNDEITHKFQSIALRNQAVTEDLHGDRNALCIPTSQMQTGEDAYPGVAVLGGAEDGRAFFYHLGFREGFISEQCHPEHGHKLFALDKILMNFLHLDETSLIGQIISGTSKGKISKWFPETLDLGVYSIGGTTLATLPGEFTVTLGHRIKNTLASETSQTRQVVLVGLANEYLSYFTTPREYNAQHYEGASTMYGQVAGLYMEQELKRISQLDPNSAAYDLKREYKIGRESSSLGEISMKEKWHWGEGLANILQDRNGIAFRHFPQFSWTDKLNYLTEGTTANLKSINPTVSIEELKDNAWQALSTEVTRLDGPGTISIREADTSSLNFVTVIESVTKDSANWLSFWLVPEGIDENGTYRFHVKGPDGREFTSEPLPIDNLRTMK